MPPDPYRPLVHTVNYSSLITCLLQILLKPLEREPPAGTPKWALSDAWKEIMQRREQEQTER